MHSDASSDDDTSERLLEFSEPRSRFAGGENQKQSQRPSAIEARPVRMDSAPSGQVAAAGSSRTVGDKVLGALGVGAS